MRARSWHDFVQFDDDGQVTSYKSYDWEGILGVSHTDHNSAPVPSHIDSHPNGVTLSGSLDDENGGDMIEVELVAGQTYTWSYRGTAEDGVVDPWLRLYGTDGTTLITEDDDGGLGRTSQITFTATASGTYYLNATSWYQADPTAPAYQDNGDYTIVQWSPETGHDAGNTIATAGTMAVGTNYAYFEAEFDQDYYAVNLTAGQVYTFTFNGGVSSGADWDDEPGESIGVLYLYDSAGNVVVPGAVNYETSITFVAQTSGTYYLRAVPYSSFGGVPGPEMTGGYTIDIRQSALEDMDPLESLNWDNAANVPTVDVDGVPTVYVYFAAAGEDVGTGETTYGWQQHQIDAVMHALNTQYTPITGINYVITTDIDQAAFKMITVQNLTYGARFYPQDPAYGSLQGIGSFNLLSGGFGSDPNSLLPGGYSYEVILHEFGHAHGVAHPHDTGGGSEIMLGVNGSASLGLFDLNQGVYTVMSYNSGWNTHPDGDRNYSAANRASGWNVSLAAFDIAVLQARYGTHDYNSGDNVYVIADTQAVANYQTIWDTGGTDTIEYVGTRNARIDLLAATLDYTPTGGGVLSFAHGVWGGYTIASGVVIENATGGSGNDALLGNSANNVLTGNGGDDVLMGNGGDDTLFGGDGNDELFGGDGNDVLNGGAGNDIITGGDGMDVVTLGDGDDIFVAEITATKVNVKGPNKGAMSVDVITDFNASGNDLIDLSGLGTAFTFKGTDANRSAGDLTFKTFDSVNGAEKALGFDIDGQSGKSTISGPVTVVYGNTDGGSADFAIVLLNTSSVAQDDFMFV